jgi:cell division protein FtsB
MMTYHKNLAVSVGLAAGIVYLVTHAVAGQHGLLAFMETRAQEASLIAERDALNSERAELVARAGRLRGAIDKDYLDERARALLGAAAPGELVFVYSSPLADDINP